MVDIVGGNAPDQPPHRLLAAVGPPAQIGVVQIGDRRPVYMAVIHANAIDDAEHVMEMLGEKLPLKARVVTSVAPTVGTHTGSSIESPTNQRKRRLYSSCSISWRSERIE